MGSEPPPPEAIVVSAAAKINLTLYVTGRQPDGYHLLDSLVAFAGIQDRLVIGPGDGLDLHIEGGFAADVPAGPGNIVLKAAALLAEVAGVKARARIDLVKRLPVSAGLGGGSADAAAALRGLSALWGVCPGEDDLLALALELGADVPVCLGAKAAYMGGIGEELQAAPPLPEAVGGRDPSLTDVVGKAIAHRPLVLLRRDSAPADPRVDALRLLARDAAALTAAATPGR